MFHAKATRDSSIQIILRDSSNNRVESKREDISNSWKLYTFKQDDFEFATGTSSFAWNSVTDIMFTGNWWKVTDLRIDGLFIIK